MATYKVLQDIEAEDTLVGPLTLRQCIYAGIAIVAGWLSYLVISRGAPFVAVVFLPFVAGGIFFAFPWSKQQPTEVWALAKVRFYLKPRKRIWNQSGVKQLVTITAPKRAPKNYTRHLSPQEVQSRLRALADTIDSRGWAVKNIELGYYSQPSILGDAASDRLIDPTGMPQDVPTLDPEAAADIFDTANNPVAHKFDALMAQSAGEHHQQLVQQMSQPEMPSPAAITQYWHMKTIQPPSHTPAAPQQAATQPAQFAPPAAPQFPVAANDDGQGIPPADPVQDYSAAQYPAPAQPMQDGRPTYRARPVGYTHRQIQPAAPQSAPSGQDNTVTDQPNPAILELANNNDLNVATIAREAQARTAGPNDEVVIDLH